MSKKMMKRSLALGALMAFVITGQAWADDLMGGADLTSINVWPEKTVFSVEQTSGNYDDVIGANYYGVNMSTTNLHDKTTVCNLQSITTTLGGDIEVIESIFGGSKTGKGWSGNRTSQRNVYHTKW